MRLIAIICVGALSFMGLFSTIAQAGSTDLVSLNCGTSDITIGMTLQEIEAKCDPAIRPAYISEHTRPIPAKVAGGELSHDLYQKWMFYPPGQQTTHVLIRNGVVMRIFVHDAPVAK